MYIQCCRPQPSCQALAFASLISLYQELTYNRRPSLMSRNPSRQPTNTFCQHLPVLPSSIAGTYSATSLVLLLAQGLSFPSPSLHRASPCDGRASRDGVFLPDFVQCGPSSGGSDLDQSHSLRGHLRLDHHDVQAPRSFNSVRHLKNARVTSVGMNATLPQSEHIVAEEREAEFACQCSKGRGSLADRIRTEKIGIAQLLCRRLVPAALACDCGWNQTTAKRAPRITEHLSLHSS